MGFFAYVWAGCIVYVRASRAVTQLNQQKSNIMNENLIIYRIIQQHKYEGINNKKN